MVFFLSYAQNVGFDVRKKMYKLPEKGGGEVIRTMPERKHSFLQEVFPNHHCHHRTRFEAHTVNGPQGSPLHQNHHCHHRTGFEEHAANRPLGSPLPPPKCGPKPRPSTQLHIVLLRSPKYSSEYPGFPALCCCTRRYRVFFHWYPH